MYFRIRILTVGGIQLSVFKIRFFGGNYEIQNQKKLVFNIRMGNDQPNDFRYTQAPWFSE